MREEAIEERKKARFLQRKSQHQWSCTALGERKPQCLIAIKYAKGNKAKGNSRATNYISAHAPTTLPQGYPQAHEQHPHHLPYVRAPVRVSHWQAVVKQGVFVLDMETAGLVPVEGWKGSHLSLIAVSWDTPPPIADALCTGLDIGAMGRRCSALACYGVSGRPPPVMLLWWCL